MHRAGLILVVLVLLAGCQAPAPGPTPQAGPSAPDPDASTTPETDPSANGTLTVEVLDVGQGDAIHVHGPNTTMLVDAGNWRQVSRQAVVEHLAHDGVDELGAFVVSHPDADHAGACADVLERVDVALIAHPGRSADTETWKRCRAAIDDEPARVVTDAEIAPGDRLEVSKHLMPRVLAVDADARDANEASLVLRLSHGSADALLTGDVGCDTEDAILARGLSVEAELLKVGHHGSSTSTCSAWLDAVDPTWAAISAGQDNPYGHPHDEVLDRLRAHDVRVTRTDTSGTLVFATNGSGWQTRATPEPEPEPETQTEPGAGPVEILTVHADAPGNDHENPNGEWVNLTATGNETVDLTGWTLSDEGGHTYRFPDGTQAPPDETLTVHTGSGNDTATHLYWGRQQAVWNNDADTARLTDASGTLVDEYAYG